MLLESNKHSWDRRVNFTVGNSNTILIFKYHSSANEQKSPPNAEALRRPIWLITSWFTVLIVPVEEICSWSAACHVHNEEHKLQLKWRPFLQIACATVITEQMLKISCTSHNINYCKIIINSVEPVSQSNCISFRTYCYCHVPRPVNHIQVDQFYWPAVAVKL